jgi:hypothetical protein
VYHPLGEMSKMYRFLVGNPEGKRPFGSPRLRWEGNIKMCLKEVMLEGTVNYPADSGTKCPAAVNAFIKFLLLIIR